MGKLWPSTVAASMIAAQLCLTVLTFWSAYGERGPLPDITRLVPGFWSANWYIVLILLSAVFIVIAFRLSFRLYEVQRPSSQFLKSLARASKADNLDTKMAGDKLVIRAGLWAAVEISATEDENKTIVSARACATASGWAVVLILAVVLSTYAIVALIVALFIFVRAHAFANQRLTKMITALRFDTPTSETLNPRSEITDTLSEGGRIASEARKSAQMSYCLKVLVVLVVFVYMLPSAVTLMIRHANDDTPDMSGDLDLYVFLASLVIGIALIAHLSHRSKPVIAEYRQWENRLENLLSAETSGKKDKLEESAVESLLEVVERIEKWTRDQKRERIYNNPLSWLLVMILLYVEITVLLEIVLGFLQFRSSLGVNLVVLSAVEVALVFVSYILVSIVRRMQARYLAYSDEDWKARKAWIDSELEKRIEEVSHAR
jgi:hypothetical protein